MAVTHLWLEGPSGLLPPLAASAHSETLWGKRFGFLVVSNENNSYSFHREL